MSNKLPDLVTTRNDNVTTVAETGSSTGEPDGDTTHLRRATEAAQGVGGTPLGQQVGVGVKVDGRHARSNVTGGDGVDTNLF